MKGREHTNMAVKSAIFIFSPFLCTLAFMPAKEKEKIGGLVFMGESRETNAVEFEDSYQGEHSIQRKK